MVFQSINNQYDRHLVSHNDKIINILRNPLHLSKEDLPQWMFIDSKLSVRDEKHYINMYALMIEYDDGYSIDEFRARFADFRYYLYTSTGHTDEHNKFRVIFPLLKPIAYSELRRKIVRNTLVAYFGDIDPTCFSNFQKLPNDINHNYKYYANKGIKYWSPDECKKQYNDELEQQAQIDAIRLSEKLIRVDKTKKFNKDAYYEAVLNTAREAINKIPNYQSGDRYRLLCSQTGKLLAATYPNGEYIFDDADVEHLILGHTDDSAVRKMVYKFSTNRI